MAKKKAEKKMAKAISGIIRLKADAINEKTGKPFPSYMYDNRYNVLTCTGDKVVFGINGREVGTTLIDSVTVQ